MYSADELCMRRRQAHLIFHAWNAYQYWQKINEDSTNCASPGGKETNGTFRWDLVGIRLRPWDKGNCGREDCFPVTFSWLLWKMGLLLERFRALQITDTVTYWRSRKSALILRDPHGQIFQITDMVMHSMFSTVKSMQWLNPYSDTVSYVSTGLNT